MKGQITKHEWVTVNKEAGYKHEKCKHCPVERWEFYPRSRYGERDIRYTDQTGTLPTLPRCITRKTQTDE